MKIEKRRGDGISNTGSEDRMQVAPAFVAIGSRVQHLAKPNLY